MTASGVCLCESIVPMYNEMKLRSNLKYTILKIEDKKKIILEMKEDSRRTCTKDEDCCCFEEMKAKLREHNEPRYILYDYEFRSEAVRDTLVHKVGFIFWCPDNCTIGVKMLYAASKDAVKKSLQGLALELQANDWDDLDYYTIVHNKIESTMR